MHKPTRFLSHHRRDRLIAWALAMLAWIASVMFTERTSARRHIRQRYGLFSLRGLARFVCKLATVRAIELSGIRKRHRPLRNAAPAGFRRRMRPRAIARAVIGARLRKACRRGGFAERLQFLIAALNDLDAFARRYLVPRALRRLTKLCAVIAIAPPRAVLRSPAAPTPALADSS